MSDQLVPVGLAVASGSCYLAYQHPDAYRRLAKTVGKAIGVLVVGWLLFQMFGEAYVDLADSKVEKAVLAAVKATAKTRIEDHSAIFFSSIAVVFGWGLFLWSFVTGLKKSKAEKSATTREAR
jgi:hypothetical protein